jgi:hypothetical protein
MRDDYAEVGLKMTDSKFCEAMSVDLLLGREVFNHTNLFSWTSCWASEA